MGGGGGVGNPLGSHASPTSPSKHREPWLGGPSMFHDVESFCGFGRLGFWGAGSSRDRQRPKPLMPHGQIRSRTRHPKLITARIGAWGRDSESLQRFGF